ncbi:MAG: HAMP domain-containing protein [Anaerolineaceae bacterium]|nr:HAMP domain-containing protein [Anaerolineaceae bacterium]
MRYLTQRKERTNGSNTKNRFPLLTSLQGKLIIPYMLLTIMLAMGGVFIVTRLVTSSIRERFVNQLFEASRVAAEGIVRQEKLHLENLRLMAYTTGVWEAVEQEDTARLQELLTPIILNNNIQILTIVNADGIELLSLEQLPNDEYQQSTRTDLNSIEIVTKTLQGQTDTFGDKFIDVLPGNNGPALFTSAPIKDESGQIAGVLLVGTPMDTMLKDIRNQALADIILLGPEEGVISTTLVRPQEGFTQIESLASDLSIADLGQTYDILLYEREFEIVFSPLTIRDQMTGLLGVVLPSSYVVSTEATSRNTLALLFTLGTLAVIIVGYFVSQNIAKPILRLRVLSQSVASGNFEQQASFKRTDEIGDLAQAFDTMTLHLKERTEEAERLYTEALHRNKELAEINEKLESTRMQLVQSEKLASVGQLTAGIVHDVKNPLAVIMGMTEFMLSEEELSPDMQHEIQTMHKSAVKGNQIVSDLLTFARQSTPDLIERDMRDTLEAALRLTGYLIKKGRVQIVRQIPVDPVSMAYDAQQIEQVLINLIANAIHAMPDGGELRVGLEQQNGNAVLRIGDTGTGIAPEHISRIFDPFFTTKPEGEGTGLGLSVSHGIIACHHGDIQVESTLGVGTTFIITLPIAHAEERAEK